jgi:hypothetical protein
MRYLFLLLVVLFGGCSNSVLGYTPGTCLKHKYENTYVRINSVTYYKEDKMVDYTYVDLQNTIIGINSRHEGSFVGEGFNDLYGDKVDCSIFSENYIKVDLNSKINSINERIYNLEHSVDSLEKKQLGKKK